MAEEIEIEAAKLRYVARVGVHDVFTTDAAQCADKNLIVPIARRT